VIDPETRARILTREEMRAERARLRREGLKLVFTNGCFDLLHLGHVRYLAEARKLGDRLLVAVNSDETVSRLKGPERPLTPLAERMEVLAALASVDYVTSFDEETPKEIIDEVLPDVLVKGGDWTVDRIVGREAVEAAGGVVRSLPFASGYSTSAIIDRIVERLGERERGS
jgi:D-beta-D-heptose 7-phosphate kinase/D-beta-D-heptose 1-phosphate adenosyltransferase